MGSERLVVTPVVVPLLGGLMEAERCIPTALTRRPNPDPVWRILFGVFSGDGVMSSADGSVGGSSAESAMRVIQSVKPSPAQARREEGVCGCWQTGLSAATWAGAQPGLIIGERRCLQSLRMADGILSCCHVRCGGVRRVSCRLALLHSPAAPCPSWAPARS